MSFERNEYPRPQFRRDEWLPLNGEWEFELDDENDGEKLTYSHFFNYLADICRELDVPTPVLLKTHIFNFAKFNHVRFYPRDFVEGVDFDYLLLENIIL